MRRTLSRQLGLVAALACASAAAAQDVDVLRLPIDRTLAVLSRPRPAPARQVSVRRRPTTATPSGQPAFIPRRIHVPDGYQIDVGRDAPRFAAPLDDDTLVSLELLAPAATRPGVALSYDQESPPIGDGSERVSLRLEYRF